MWLQGRHGRLFKHWFKMTSLLQSLKQWVWILACLIPWPWSYSKSSLGKERSIFNKWLWPWLITYKMGKILPASQGLGETSMKIFLRALKYCTMHMERDFVNLLPIYWIHKRWSHWLTQCCLLFPNQRGPGKLPWIHENFGSFPTHWR